MEPVRLIVYSDYLCPWCFNASVRLHRLRDELGGALRLEWRSFLLRPQAKVGRDLERFRAYTQSWMRPAADGDAGTFRAWEGDAGPPSHSVPPHVVAKAAQAVGDDAFERMHDALLHAYFAESRDVSARETLLDLWRGLDLPPERFPEPDDPALTAEVLRQHQGALEAGVTGVPAVQVAGNDAVIVGAHPIELYRRWVERTLRDRS